MCSSLECWVLIGVGLFLLAVDAIWNLQLRKRHEEIQRLILKERSRG